MADSLSPRPGDRFVRRPRPRPVTVDLATARPTPPRSVTPLILVYAFGGLILLGTVALLLPFASEEPGWTPFMDAFFTATSAATVTGLIVEDTGTAWAPFGEVVILGLIQVGGIGIMTMSTGLFLLLGRRLGLRERVTLAVESSGRASLGGAVRIAKRIAVMVLIVETLGFIAFTIRFSYDFPLPTAMWHGLFHAVSSFNNAGFMILPGENLGGFHTDTAFMMVTALLIILGSISFVLIADLLGSRRLGRLTLDSKIVLATTIGLWFVGMVVILGSEFTNSATLGTLGLGDKLTNSFFESVSGRTAGFSASVTDMHEYTWIVMMMMMFIGGASGSTTGGMKVNTFGVLLATVVSSIRGRPNVEAFRRQIPEQQVSLATTLFMLGIASILVVAFVLIMIEDARPLELVFEAVSAFGTNGNSTGITETLSMGGQLLIIFAMFAGKIGPLTIALLLAQRRQPVRFSFAQDSVRIG